MKKCSLIILSKFMIIWICFININSNKLKLKTEAGSKFKELSLKQLIGYGQGSILSEGIKNYRFKSFNPNKNNRNSLEEIEEYKLLELNVERKRKLKKKDDKTKNQTSPYPNYYEAAVKNNDLKSSGYSIPKLSKVMNELDPTKKYKLEEFTSIIKFQQYNLSLGELTQIFLFIDVNKDSVMDIEEWESFANLFLLPFEACMTHSIDKSDTNIFKFGYYLNVNELKFCFDKDPRAKNLVFRRRNQSDYIEFLAKNLSKYSINNKGDKSQYAVNIFTYLFIRKSLFSWDKCSSTSKYISVSAFRCAITTNVPNKYTLKSSIDKIYKVGLELSQQDNALIQLDFIDYTRVAYIYYCFTVIKNNDNDFLEETQFIKAIKEDVFPTNFTEKEINIIFSITKGPLEFEGFGFFLSTHLLFNFYSIEKPFVLNEDEYFNMLLDEYFPVNFIMQVDSSEINFTKEEYQEVSLVLQRYRTNENKFYFGFKQDGSSNTSAIYTSSTVNSKYHDIKPNIISRKASYGIIGSSMGNLYRALHLSKIYNNLCGKDNNTSQNLTNQFVCNSVEINQRLEKVAEETIPLLNPNYKEFSFYKSVDKEFKIDFLSFLGIEFFNDNLGIRENKNKNINETTLKEFLKRTQMENIQDTVLDLAKSSPIEDKLKRRLFNPEKLKFNIFTVQIAASERRRTNKILL